jgi:carboxyl-terminal processing protease
VAQSEFGPIKESDLANHLTNDKSAKKGDKKGDEKPEEALAVQDYPLNEALNLLKGIYISRQAGK